MTVNGARFIDNTAQYGGAVYNGEDVTIANSTFTGNSTSAYGGGIEVESGTLHVIGGFFKLNMASTDGGGIANYATATATVEHTTFTANEADREGGGIDVDGTLLTMHDTTFNSNTATYGGGVYSETPWTLHDGSFDGNTATEGAGIYNRGTVTLTHTLVAHNTLSNCSPVASVPGCFG